MSVHNLPIESGRYGRNRLERPERICKLCNTAAIEDDFHFFCICTSYNELRQVYTKRYYRVRPSIMKFLQLLSSKNRNVIVNLCKFISIACKKRNNILLELS